MILNVNGKIVTKKKHLLNLSSTIGMYNGMLRNTGPNTLLAINLQKKPKKKFYVNGEDVITKHL